MPDPLKEITDSALLEVARRRSEQLALVRGAIERLPDGRPVGGGPTQNRISNLDPRTPFVMTCDRWVDEENRYLIWAFNPHQVHFEISQRGEKQETRNGYVMHYWKNPETNTFFKPFTMTLDLQAGNIMPLTWPSLPNNIPQVPEGLVNFYTFMELVDEPKRYVSTALNGQTKSNFQYIIYNSRIFPRITFKGMFQPESVFSFSESAHEPNMIDQWQAKFEVSSTTPALTSQGAIALRRAWEAEQQGSSPVTPGQTTPAGPRQSPQFGEIGEPGSSTGAGPLVFGDIGEGDEDDF